MQETTALPVEPTNEQQDAIVEEKPTLSKKDVIVLTGKCGFNAPLMKYAIMALNAGYRYFLVDRTVHEIVAGENGNPNRLRRNVCHKDEVIWRKRK